MAFTAIGQLAGEPATVTWNNGRLSGDPWAVAEVLDLTLRLEGTDVGPVEGPYTSRLHMTSPISAMTIIARAFDQIDDVTGDVPQRPALPPGAIG